LSALHQTRFSLFFYALFIRIFALAARIAAVFSTKARDWVAGRKNWAPVLEQQLSQLGAGPRIWMHCASAGEFEQGKPVLEALRQQYPDHRIVVSFFSPSGYVVGSKYKGADLVTYLPLDTRRHAARFVELLQPSLAVFVKYDFWYRHLEALSRRNIPLLLVSAIFRPKQAFFKWYGGTQRRLLHFFTWLFVQDEASVKLLASIGVSHCSAAGDTRFDRVARITENPAPIPLVEAFVASGESVLVAGSTWKEDEDLLRQLPWEDDLKLVIAPHEIGAGAVSRLRQAFGAAAVTYSELDQQKAAIAGKRVLIIDNFGMLSRLYRYATITYIGGGFNKSGIHNTLEAAAWGKPVLFGPNYRKFREAVGLIEAEAGESVDSPARLSYEVSQLRQAPALPAVVGERARRYVEANIGATGRILQFIQEKRLLTRP
jgi:3-deoxy-D-manno-octulosonic-acid transferase